MNQISSLNQLTDAFLPLLNAAMLRQTQAAHAQRLGAAMWYSLRAGGKRLRPLLLAATATEFGRPLTETVGAAGAIEFIHTYSLIHDDLPAMDNAALRRGQASNHVQFDEATAILAGDALLTDAFGLVADDTLPAVVSLQVTRELAVAAGSTGMVAGQMLDIENDNQELALQDLQNLHRHKTGALLRAAVRMGGIIGGATAAELAILTEFAAAFGLAFQIKDDIEDATASTAELGKPAGQDAVHVKTTYVSLFGVAGARAQLRNQYEAARSALLKLGRDVPLLLAITDYLK